MNANELADAMEIRASIRRKATSRKSVTEGANDRLADQLEQAATMLRQQQAEIEALKKSCLDEIFKRTYANQSAKVMEGYWQEAQAEIEALKLQLHTTLTNRDLRTYDGKTEMNNEPVAWMEIEEGGITEYKVWREPVSSKSIPLYTHPVKEHDIGISHAIGFDDGFKAGMQRAVEMNVVKELTDKEILELWDWDSGEILATDLLDFADAILRKAQEK